MEFKLPQINGEDVARMIRTSQNTNSNTPIVAVTGYLKDLMQPHHFDALVEKPMTSDRLIEMFEQFCFWKPPPPERLLMMSDRKDSINQLQRHSSSSRDGRASPSFERFMASNRGSGLGQMPSRLSASEDQDYPSRKASPLSIPRSTKAEWDSLDIKRPTEASPPVMRKPSPKHLEPPPAFMIRPIAIPPPSQTIVASKMATIIRPKSPATQTLPAAIITPSSPEKTPEKKSKRFSFEKKVFIKKDSDVEDADDELSKSKKPSKSRSISDFTAKIKRVSAEMKRSKSNISE